MYDRTLVNRTTTATAPTTKISSRTNQNKDNGKGKIHINSDIATNPIVCTILAPICLLSILASYHNPFLNEMTRTMSTILVPIKTAR